MEQVKSLVLWPNRSCNLKCIYCYANISKKESPMDIKTAFRAIDAMGSGPLKIQFAGGEPLLSLDILVAVCNYVKDRKNTSLSIQTNGTLINDRFIKLAKENKIRMGISLDSIPRINEKQRGLTKEAILGIKKLQDEKISVNINSVVSKYNIGYLNDFFDFCYSIENIRGISLSLVRERRETKKPMSPSLEDLETYLENLYLHYKEINSLSNRYLGIRQFEEGRIRLNKKLCNDNYCHSCLGNSFVIMPDGDVYPCGSLNGNRNYYMGNINNSQIKILKLKKVIFSECSTCEYARYCVGICPSIDKYLDNATIHCNYKYKIFEILKKYEGEVYESK